MFFSVVILLNALIVLKQNIFFIQQNIIEYDYDIMNLNIISLKLFKNYEYSQHQQFKIIVE